MSADGLRRQDFVLSWPVSLRTSRRNGRTPSCQEHVYGHSLGFGAPSVPKVRVVNRGVPNGKAYLAGTAACPRSLIGSVGAKSRPVTRRFATATKPVSVL